MDYNNIDDQNKEHIKNMREAAKNRVYFFSEETRKKISIANTGRRCSEETKEKIRQAKKERDEKRKNNE